LGATRSFQRVGLPGLYGVIYGVSVSARQTSGDSSRRKTPVPASFRVALVAPPMARVSVVVVRRSIQLGSRRRRRRRRQARRQSYGARVQSCRLGDAKPGGGRGGGIASASHRIADKTMPRQLGITPRGRGARPRPPDLKCHGKNLPQKYNERPTWPTIPTRKRPLPCPLGLSNVPNHVAVHRSVIVT
jgi:hypothetical protein